MRAFISIAVALACAVPVGAYKVVNVGATTADGMTGVIVVTDERPVVRHLLVDDPPRLVVDLIGAENGLPRLSFTSVPVPGIVQVRTSQFSEDPDVVRVVIDLAARFRYVARVEDGGVAFGLQMPSVAAGADWAAVPETWARQRLAIPTFAPESRAPAVSIPESTPPSGPLPRAVEATRVTVPSTPPDRAPVAEAPPLGPEQGVVSSIFGSIPREVLRVDLQAADTARPGTTGSLEAYPRREIVVYNDGGRRDPFSPLDVKMQVEFGVLPPPNVENLTLVGILEDYAGNRALCEDREGYGYILKSGDRVQNGFVVQVQRNAVIFSIQEYGWQRTVALELVTPTR